jgi:hypothetical protein
LSETGSALRATSDALIQDLEQLSSLEEQKRHLRPDDPRTVRLAAEVESIAQRVLAKTVRQRELTEDAREQARTGDPDAPHDAIAETPRAIHQILADWRDAERRASDAAPGSAEARAAEAEIDRLRDEYRRAHEDATQKKQS